MWGLFGSSAEQRAVKIKVVTTIWNDNNKETFEFVTFGRYYEKASSFYLQYDEEQEVGIIKSTLKISNDRALLLRSGAINMRMTFQKDEETTGKYETPYGTMAMITKTKKLTTSFNRAASKGSISIVYDLNMNGAHVGTYELQLMFEEEME